MKHPFIKPPLYIVFCCLFSWCTGKPGHYHHDDAYTQVPSANTTQNTPNDTIDISAKLQSALHSDNAQTFFKQHHNRDTLMMHCQQLYKLNDYLPFWYKVDTVQPAQYPFEQLYELAINQGLDPDDYDLKQLFKQHSLLSDDDTDKRSEEKVIQADLLQTAALLSLSHHLYNGRISAHTIDKNYEFTPEKRNISLLLSRAIDSESILPTLQQLPPKHTQYTLLKQALQHYLQLAQKQQPQRLPEDTLLQLGDSGRVVKQLTHQLAQLSSGAGLRGDSHFTQATVRAIKRYQHRHGLKPDGVFGPATASHINTTPQQRVGQIRVNMERLRWAPRHWGNKHVLVNVPEFRLRVFENDKTVQQMRVIVGETMHSTPMFSDGIQYLVFSPTWTVPLSISSEELLPKIKKDPAYLEQKDMHLYNSWDDSAKRIDPFSVTWQKISHNDFSFKIVQQPGPGNALGTIKFIFPNSSNIYLHDTPSKNLFEENQRTFSHGCIRVEKPVELAHYLLNSDAERWQYGKIQNARFLPQPDTVHLAESIPVHIVYLTCRVDQQNVIHFYEDIYGHDAAHTKALQRIDSLL